mgnify:CR=1 FL=1
MKHNFLRNDPGYQVKVRYAYKVIVLTHYSHGKPTCTCCTCDLIEYLTIDHIQGLKSQIHRAEAKRHIWAWLIKNDFPEGFQVLCTLCNSSKNKHGECVYHKYFPSSFRNETK